MGHKINKIGLLIKDAVLITAITLAIAFIYLNRNTILQRLVPQRPLCNNCNVILVSLDTLSANHLPCYGYDRDTAPNLCRFAQQNILFQKAYANATWTLPSHVSIFTGLYPETHKIIDYGDSLNTATPILPEILQKQGYTTIFANDLSSPTLPVATVYNRGISKYIDAGNDPGSWTEPLAVFKSAVTSGKKTFMFLHVYNTHMPYLIGDSPKLFTSDSIPGIPIKDSDFDSTSSAYFDFLLKSLTDSVKARDKNPAVLDTYRNIIPLINTYKTNPKLLAKKLEPYQSSLSFFTFDFNSERYRSNIDMQNPRDIAYIRALYDQRIHQMDESRLKELFSFLNSKEIKDSTVVIITSDHGEEFMEHGHISHETIYDSNLSIPMIMSVPGLKKSVTIPAPVQSADIVPTILGIVGITTPYAFQGANLVPLMKGQQLQHRVLVANGYHLETKALREGPWKLLLRKEDGAYAPDELYDTQKDPGETTDLFFSDENMIKKMLQEYQSENAKPTL